MALGAKSGRPLLAAGVVVLGLLLHGGDGGVILAQALAQEEMTLDRVAEGFQSHMIGYTVDQWSTVDLENDALWELLIQTGSMPTQVGVLDPRTMNWRDGPRALPRDFRGWGVCDLNEDGSYEYLYGANSSVYLFDPRTDQDTLLWTAEFNPTRFLFWGFDDDDPTVALLRDFSSSYAYWQDMEYYYGSTNDWNWYVYNCLTAEQITVFGGGVSSPCRSLWLGDDLGTGCGFHESYLHDSHYGQFDSYTRSQALRVYSSQWDNVLGISLPRFSHFDAFELIPPPGLWGLDALAAIAPVATNDPLILWRVSEYGSYYWPASDYLTPQMGGAQTQSSIPNWETTFAVGQYQSMAASDLGIHSELKVIIPLRQLNDWEIRDPSTGAILDTIPDMPIVDLHNGPLVTPGGNDLFYISADTLYIWQPTPTGILDEDSEESQLPDALALHVAPNPSNSSVRFSWSAGAQLEKLVIYDILGRRVRTMGLSRSSSLTSSLVWDTTDDDGRVLASGVYFARLHSTLAEAVTTKVVVMR